MTFPAATPGSAPVPSNGAGGSDIAGVLAVPDIAYTQHHQVSTAKDRDRIFHRYGPNVRLLWSPARLSLLARFGSPTCLQPELNRLLEQLYRGLLMQVVDEVFPIVHTSMETRMVRYHSDKGHYRGVAVDKTAPVTLVDVARAGMRPTEICQMALCDLVDPRLVYVDHIMSERTTNEAHQVTGAQVFGRKYAGHGVDGHIVIYADPMGATGGSLKKTIHIAKQEVSGTPRCYVVMCLIVTPEFLRAMRALENDLGIDVHVFACRLDRGMSDPDVLKTVPGTHWDMERGLNEMQYIVPGAGGVGEVLNNALS